MPNPYADYDVAGKEISSTYEGRHITLPASYFNHPTHAAPNLVLGKDPVTFGTVADGYGVGVAFSSASGVNDLIAVDTEGIWALTVYALNDEGASAVRIGDTIFINRTTCVLSKISSDTTNIVFGYALDTIDAGYDDVIAVKVHWDPWYDVYRDYTGSGNEDALLIDVDDGSTPAAGYNRGLYINYNNIADKTGTAEVNPLAIDLGCAQDVPHAFVASLYSGISGSPTIDYWSGIYLYMDAKGTATINRNYGIQLEIDNTNPAAGEDGFIYCYRHGTNVLDSMIRIENAAGTATNFLMTPAAGAPISGGADSTDCTHRIACSIGGATKYLHLFST